MSVITRPDLQARLAAGAVTLVEALPEQYYAEAHLPGAVRINIDEVAELAPGLLPDRDAAIVVYCASSTCRNSHTVAAKLRAGGYRDVSVYADGKADWIEAGLPVESGALV